MTSGKLLGEKNRGKSLRRNTLRDHLKSFKFSQSFCFQGAKMFFLATEHPALSAAPLQPLHSAREMGCKSSARLRLPADQGSLRKHSDIVFRNSPVICLARPMRSLVVVPRRAVGHCDDAPTGSARQQARRSGLSLSRHSRPRDRKSERAITTGSLLFRARSVRKTVRKTAGSGPEKGARAPPSGRRHCPEAAPTRRPSRRLLYAVLPGQPPREK